MITPQYREILNGISTTQYGRALQEYLEEELNKIDTVVGVKSLEEVIGRQHAVDLIKKIFAFTKEQKVDTKSKNQYN